MRFQVVCLRQSCWSYVVLSSMLNVYHEKICLKFASHYFLLYAVYICQKSSNFTYAFKCYQQNCKWLHFSWTTVYTLYTLAYILLCYKTRMQTKQTCTVKSSQLQSLSIDYQFDMVLCQNLAAKKIRPKTTVKMYGHPSQIYGKMN